MEKPIKERALYRELEARPGTVARIRVEVVGRAGYEFRYTVRDGDLYCEAWESGTRRDVPRRFWEAWFIELCDQVDDGIWDEVK